jgi:hypothetical protein
MPTQARTAAKKVVDKKEGVALQCMQFHSSTGHFQSIEVGEPKYAYLTKKERETR